MSTLLLLTSTTQPSAEVLPIERRAQADVDQWARRFVQAAIEIVGGDRPVAQLLRWTSAEVYDELLGSYLTPPQWEAPRGRRGGGAGPGGG